MAGKYTLFLRREKNNGTPSNRLESTVWEAEKGIWYLSRVTSFYARDCLFRRRAVWKPCRRLADEATRRARVAQLSGAKVVLAAAWFAVRLPALRELIRSIYRRIGILPDISSGVPTVADIETEDETEDEPSAG